MYSDNPVVLQILSLLKQYNISRVVVSPGSRHFSLIHSMEADKWFKLYSVVDERSAAFFAIGLIQKTGRPVAIACTSGTACMNYSSAVIEAFYQHLPLLVLSADRLPMNLDQMEDQMYDQLNSFSSCLRYKVQLPVISTDLDMWYCNRVLNEAFLELDHHGRGPVHINIPFARHDTDTFSTAVLPQVRKISRYDAETCAETWKELSERLRGNKVLIILGQSLVGYGLNGDLLSEFCDNYDAVVLTDKLSNYHNRNCVSNATAILAGMTREEFASLYPDIVISIGANYLFNGEAKSFIRKGCAISWQIGKEDKIIDPFHSLSCMFEMSEDHFFQKMVETCPGGKTTAYRDIWRQVSEKITEPEPGYNEFYAIKQLMKSIPEGTDLQLANSLTVRMAQMVNIDHDVRVFCNRGVNGIDGSMSTAVGYATENERMTVYITGDLSFFYDMNSLGIRHLSDKMRILLINNGGGGVMYSPLSLEMRKTLSDHVAAGHALSAMGWVESLGIKYFQAHNKEEVDMGVRELFDSDSQGPMLLEVFTTINPDDVNALPCYSKSLDRRDFQEKVVDKLKYTVKKISEK